MFVLQIAAAIVLGFSSLYAMIVIGGHIEKLYRARRFRVLSKEITMKTKKQHPHGLPHLSRFHQRRRSPGRVCRLGPPKYRGGKLHLPQSSERNTRSTLTPTCC